jgi:hypothetical protein
MEAAGRSIRGKYRSDMTEFALAVTVAEAVREFRRETGEEPDTVYIPDAYRPRPEEYMGMRVKSVKADLPLVTQEINQTEGE